MNLSDHNLAPVRDGCGRVLRYLRVSVTDRCNLRCRYCMPSQGIARLRRQDLLTFEEMTAVAGAAAGLGVTAVRLTGGEPLVRRDLVALVAMLAGIEGIRDLSMTTNGIALAGCAPALARAGLRRVNLSLDSLDPREYADLTRGGDLEAALQGLRAALAAGLDPVKINAVAFARTGSLQRWIAPFIALARALPVHVRFIEHMPIGWGAPSCPRGPEMERILQALGAFPDGQGMVGAGPARYWQLPGAAGRIGLITPMSAAFCRDCNRLRLTAAGALRRCVFGDADVDLLPYLRPRLDAEGLAAALTQAWLTRGQDLGPPARPALSMCQVGG